VGKLLLEKEIAFHTSKDQVIFEKEEVLKDDGKPYTVFTPYMRKWRATLNEFYISSYPTEKYFSSFYRFKATAFPSPEAIGFHTSGRVFPPPSVSDELIKAYASFRDIPSLPATSKLSLHLRFGTVSVRRLVRHALKLSDTWVNELIWREFFMQILWHFPGVVEHSFREEYDRIRWRNNEKEFQAWCKGQTGYPMVDAGMRELNATGFMHNRVRMVTASFLVKHLLIDWRWGEAYFAEKLLDYDLSANNGNWQWAARTGTDAAPYFRIFNPSEQLKKFDPELVYVKKWVPEFGTAAYPAPIVDHVLARERCLRAYKVALGK
jgi:deoxyribodipyrimidine photo-lyase